MLKQHIEQNIYDKQANLQECQDNQEQYAAVLKQYRMILSNCYRSLMIYIADKAVWKGKLERTLI